LCSLLSKYRVTVIDFCRQTTNNSSSPHHTAVEKMLSLCKVLRLSHFHWKQRTVLEFAGLDTCRPKDSSCH